MLITVDYTEYLGMVDELRELKQKLKNLDNTQVTYGIDWGKQHEQTVVCIMKHYPDGTKEIVAIETEPRK